MRRTKKLWAGFARFAGLPLCLCLLLAAPPVRAESFVRRLAERALARGMQQEARGDIAQALTSYDEAVRTDTTLGAASLRLGALRERLGDLGQAELLYSQATRSPDAAADAYYARALLRRAARRTDEALSDLLESTSRSPEPARLRLLASWLVEARRWPAALNVWRALLASAHAQSDPAAEHEARVSVSALSLLAGDTDAVQAGADSSDWVRRSLARLSRLQGPRPQGARKLTP